MNYYVGHFTGGKGIIIKAENRKTARKIGRKAEDEIPDAVVREDEGATITDEEKEYAATESDPYKFEEFLNMV